jgi:extradiol dioxygenase family protein
VRQQTAPLFHLAFPVYDLAKTRVFYTEQLGCTIGRESDRWIDFNFFGHQITAHLVNKTIPVATNPVDGHAVPIHHFGVILDWNAWHELADKLKAAETDFVIKPGIRFKGQAGEQATMFIRDPSGNALEFKSFRKSSAVFAQDIR